MKWIALTIALLLAGVPVAIAEDDVDGTDASGPEYGLAAYLMEGYNQSHKDELSRLVQEFDARGPHYTPDSTTGHLPFGIDGLRSEDDCHSLQDLLERKEYIVEVEDCRVTREADGSPPAVDETPDEDSDGHNETKESDEHETDEPDKEFEDEREEGHEDDRNETDEREDDNPCRDREGSDRADCYDDYCESPDDEHVDECRKWQSFREDQEDREEIKEEFTVCREDAETASDRRECARDHHDAVQEEHDEEKAERQAQIAAAKERRHIGAEVSVRAGAGVFAASDDVVEYDVDVVVETVDARAGDDAVDFRVTVSAELDEGRTIVMDVDPSVLSGPTLVVRYFTVNDDGTETEVIIREASDLSDILDPTNDAGQPEYWIVKDANGLQMMASIPHWSTHALTVQGFGEAISTPSVLVGITVGVVGSVMAAATLFWPRKPEE